MKDLGYVLLPGNLRARLYEDGECRILVSQDHGLWHLSISCENRYPTWDEIKRARYELLANSLTMAMLLPPVEDYVNIHENCFHLWQIEDPQRMVGGIPLL